jgi:hypothetical protein
VPKLRHRQHASEKLPSAVYRLPWPTYPSDAERKAHLEEVLERDLKRLEDLNRQELERMRLPTDLSELNATLLKQLPRDRGGRPRKQGVPDTVKRGWSILHALMAIPKTRLHAREGDAYLAAIWALKSTSSGQYGEFAFRGVRARQQTHKAAQSPKYCRGILALLEEKVLRQPRITVKTFLESLPEAHGDLDTETVFGDDGRQYDVYRDGNQFVQVDGSGRSRALNPRSLERYLKRVKENRRSRRSADSAE